MTSVALADELLLLAYDDETGRSTVSRIALDLGLVGAVLVDLVLLGRVTVEGGLDGTAGSWTGPVRAVDATPTGEPVADDVLARIAADTPHSTSSWIQRLRHGLRDRLLGSLCDRGIMRLQDETALEHIHLSRYPAVDSTVEKDTRARLAAALTGRDTPDERTAALAALVAGVRMEPTLGLPPGETAEAHRRLEEIAAAAGFGGTTVLENSTVRPSVAFVIAELHRAVGAALGNAAESRPAERRRGDSGAKPIR